MLFALKKACSFVEFVVDIDCFVFAGLCYVFAFSRLCRLLVDVLFWLVVSV